LSVAIERAHGRVWAAARQFPLGVILYRDRLTRVTALAVAHVVVALAFTALGPLWLLLLGPLLLGVPHVAADVRHLVLRPPRPLPRGMLLALGAPFAAMTLLRGATLAGWGSWPTLELTLGALSIATAALWARGRRVLQAAIVVGTAVLLVPALLWPGHAALLLGHTHNVVAIALWMVLMGKGTVRWIVPLAIAAALFCIGMGALEPLVVLTGGLGSVGGLDLRSMTDTLAPDLPGPWGLRLVLAFAMLQAVHYSLWIWCIPASPTFSVGTVPTSPRAAWSSWWRDLGPAFASVVLLAAIALPVAALWDPAAVRAGYLSLVVFHGWLELAIAAHFLVLNRAPH
jgi:hypothetical protein